MKYIQFYKLSAGCVPGSIPPIYKEELRKPTEAIGSDGIMILDQRYALRTIIPIASKQLKGLNNMGKGYIGYKVMQGEFLYGRPIYSSF